VALELDRGRERVSPRAKAIAMWTKLIAGMAAMAAGRLRRRPGNHQPAAMPPAAWSSPVAGGLTDNAVRFASWWTSFNDAELNSLIGTGRYSQSGFAGVRSPGCARHGRCVA